MFRIAILCAALAAACGNSNNSNNFATFQACFDEHTKNEGFTVPCAVEICCIDHGIGSAKMNTVCGDTAQTCESYVTANLSDSADTTLTQDITTACTNYVFDSGRGGTGPGGQCGS